MALLILTDLPDVRVHGGETDAKTLLDGFVKPLSITPRFDLI